MKTICIYFLVFFTLPAFSQNKKSSDDVYYTPKLTIKEQSVIADKSVADHITLCLVKYHDDRMLGLVFTGIAAGLAVGSTQINEKDSSDELFIASGVFALASFIIYIDAEKWISRKRIVFTGDKLSYRF